MGFQGNAQVWFVIGAATLENYIPVARIPVYISVQRQLPSDFLMTP